MGEPRESGRIFGRWQTLEAFRESVHKKVKRERLQGVRFHETKHTGISALLEAGYSVPEVCKISGNSHRTIAHYAHVNEKRVFEKWKSFEYGATRTTPAQASENRTASVQQDSEKLGPNRAPEGAEGFQRESDKRIHFSTNS